MLATVLGSVSEFYSRSLSSSVTYRFQVHREQGRWLHRAPLGYRNVQEGGTKTLAFDEAAPLLKQVFEMIASGEYSSEQVRTLITAAGLRNKKGQKLTKQTFSFRVKNPVYAGLLVHKGKTYKASFPALVSEELWQKAQDCLRGKNKAIPKKPTNESFPLRGLVKCGHCYAKLTSGNVRGRSKVYPKYWCANEACSHRVSVSVEKLEADWLEFLERMQPAFDALVNVLPMLAKAKAGERIAETEHKQRTLATRLAEKKAMNVKLITAKLNGEIAQEDFDALKPALVKDIEEIEAAQRALISQAEAFLHLTADVTRQSVPAKAMWISAPLGQKQTVQSVLFPNGICYHTDVGFFEPVSNELESMIFQGLLEVSRQSEVEKELEVVNGGPGWT